MENTKKLSKKIFLLGILLFGVIGITETRAINNASDGYSLLSSEVRNITLSDGSCRRITNDGTNRFIPTKSMSEWDSFSGVAISRGITIASCVVPCSSGYYRASNGLCISALRGPHSYQVAWDNCVSEGSAMLGNGNIRGITVSEVCNQSGNCGVMTRPPPEAILFGRSGKMIWNPESQVYNSSNYNNYYISLCHSDGCDAHAGNFPFSSYPSPFVSLWGSTSNGTDDADGTHYYFCVKTGCPPNMQLIGGQCYSEILGPSTFISAYNTCVGTYGTTILTGENINNVAWRSWDVGQVNYSVTLPDGNQYGSTSCYPSIFPPPNQDVSCWGTAPTINQVFAADHVATGAAGTYNGTAWYRCKKSAS